MDKMDEQVLVVKTSKLFPNGVWEGFKLATDDDFLKIINKYKEFKRRGDVEDDANYQQIIAQIVLITQAKIFIHKIPGSGSEARLHDMYPIFLGGHINNQDVTIDEAIDREFREEINYQGKIVKKEFGGIVNLMDNPVNSVHVGLVWIFLGDSEAFKDTNDDGVIDGKFMPWGEAEKLLDKMTYWSKVVFPVIKEKYEEK